jgi:hypothetical protein
MYGQAAVGRVAGYLCHVVNTQQTPDYHATTCYAALQVYERAIPAVPKEQRLSVLELYVSRATDFFGIAKVRSSSSSSSVLPAGTHVQQHIPGIWKARLRLAAASYRYRRALNGGYGGVLYLQMCLKCMYHRQHASNPS